MVKLQSCQCLLSVLLVFVLGNTGKAFANNSPAWFVDGRPTANAVEAAQILATAEVDGLNPHDYSADSLAQSLK